MHHVIIVGGGPAALAAAVYALDKQLDLLVITEEIGGKAGMLPTVDGEESVAWQVSEAAAQLFGRALSVRQDLHMRDRVVDINKVADGFEVVTQRHGIQQGKVMIVATGVAPLTLNVPGAQQWLGYGLGYSPTTFAHRLHSKTVAVIGTTRRALRGAAELARTAAQVYVILPDAKDEAPSLLAHLRICPNVSVFAGYQVTELLGSSQVERINIVRDDEQAYLPVNAVFADLGLLPHSEMVRRMAAVDQDGFILVDGQYATSVPGLFAAGDVCSMFSEHIVVALGDGTRAASSAYDYLLSRSTLHSGTDQA